VGVGKKSLLSSDSIGAGVMALMAEEVISHGSVLN